MNSPDTQQNDSAPHGSAAPAAENARALAITACAVLAAIALAFAGSQGSTTIDIYGRNLPVVMLCVMVSFCINWLVFLPSWFAGTERYYDLTGAACFILLTLLALLLSPDHDTRTLILALMICIWACRLGSFLFLRIQKSGSDGRFDDIKPFFTRFLMTWSMQALWVFVTSSAALVAITSTSRQPLEPMAFAGIAIWAVGFLIEIVADYQKRQFRADLANKDRFIRSGLWAWSRHPNYFGEIMLWTGVALLAAPVLHGWQLLSLISPLFVALLLTRISGIPMLEARSDQRWGNDADYQHYKAVTPALLPRPPRG